MRSHRQRSDSLLQRQHVSSRDGVSVDEGEKLLEDAEEGPVRQHTDALLHLKTAVSDGPPVQHAQQTQMNTLTLGQTLAAIRLIELYGSTVHLNTSTFTCHHMTFSLKPLTRFLLERHNRASLCFITDDDI